VPSDLVDLSRVEALVLDGRSCLSMSGRQWIDEAKGREIKKKLCTQPHLYRAAVMYLASSERPPWSIITFSIAVGIPGSESILTDLLYLLDDSVTAQILANSGSSDLRSAAGAWAAARGMMMVQKDGPGTVTWGCV
jgi:hypothetical protein